MQAPVVLQLDTIDLERAHTFWPRTPEDKVAASIEQNLKSVVADNIIRNDFDVRELPELFTATFDENIDGILPEILRGEEDAYSEEDKPTIRKVGSSALTLAATNGILLDAENVADIRRQIAEQPPEKFAVIDMVHKAWETTPYAERIREVNNLFGEGITDPEQAMQIYVLLIDTATNPDFEFPTELNDALYIFTYLPHGVRQLTKRIVINRALHANMQAILGDSLTEGEQQVLGAFESYFTASALHGEHWNNLTRHAGLPAQAEHLPPAMALQELTALFELRRLREAGAGDRVVTAYELAREVLNEGISRLSDENGAHKLMSTDTGHCFNGFGSHALRNALVEPGSRGYEYMSKPQKTGQRAVILEDNLAQQVLWSDFVDKFTSHTVAEGDIYATPEGIRDTFLDPNVTLFMLDIQNGDDLSAGLRVADELFHARYDATQAAPENFPAKTKIIIWSASPDALKEADRHFKALAHRGGPYHGKVDTAFYGTGGENSNKKIEIEVKPKDLDQFDIK